jgi:hypothetical protein
MRIRRPIQKTCVISNYPDLFAGSHDASHVLALNGQWCEPMLFAQKWERHYKVLEYAHYDGDDRSEVPSRHIITELCAKVGITGSVLIRPHLILSPEEKSSGTWATGKIAIQSSALGGKYPMLNKEWYPERFQSVVDQLRDEFDFIQLGSGDNPRLQHVHDLRGVTSMRESSAILHNARMYVGPVGFLMHLARAVDCPSVIVFGGREAPWQSGYICNMNLYAPVPCAPCWRWSGCDFGKMCMNEITVNDVICGVRTMARRPRGPLEVETVDVS